MLKSLVKYVSLFALLCLSNSPLNAKEINDFMRTFSALCYQNLANMDSTRVLLEYEGWEPVDEKTMAVLGKPANPEAVVEGYKILKDKKEKKGFIIALTEVPNSNEKVCTLLSIGKDDYSNNISLLEEYFEVTKISSNKEGLSVSEIWRIKHPMFSDAVVMTQKYSDRPRGEDLAQFHIYGTN